MTKKSGGAAAKAYQDDAATRMIQQLREQEAVLREQLAGTDKLGAAQRELIKFEQQITDLKEKRQLTADQKSLLAAQEAIKAQLQKNAAIEASVKLREEELREEKRIADLNKQFNERSRQREETIRNNSDSRNEQYQKSLGAFGLSERQRQEVEAQRTVYREFQRMQLDLVKNTPKEILGSDKYVAEMLKIKEAQDQALQDLQSYFDSVRQLQGDWTNGATRALSTYVDDVANVSAQVERLFTNTFSGLEDSLVSFVKTGKLSFTDLADSIATDISRIIIRQQITGPLAQMLQGRINDGSGAGGLLGSLFGGLFGSVPQGADGTAAASTAALAASSTTAAASVAALATAAAAATTSLGGQAATSTGGGIFSWLGGLFGGARANGGPTQAGKFYEVNERGSELFTQGGKTYLMSSGDGRVDPIRGGGSQTSMPINVYVPPQTTRATGTQIASEIQRKLAMGVRNS
ncbi:phage tail tape measure protein [Delftia tsuruhatensis]|uniref:Phage tail tape measure protein n=2 Tax=Delftia tsuruhatensis TaxID=180282 RepID=A0ABN4SFK2_9BURK|nr:phage tail tape measure protein [Delftia tsuruhatensis]